jgi:hypothetical protein
MQRAEWWDSKALPGGSSEARAAVSMKQMALVGLCQEPLLPTLVQVALITCARFDKRGAATATRRMSRAPHQLYFRV